MADFDVIDSVALLPASELEVQLVKLPSGEVVVRFEDCTGGPPIIYKWCLDAAVEWLRTKI